MELTPVACCAGVLIEDGDSSHLRVDFANKDPGGGVLRNGAVQEEILMVIFPEMLCARLLCARLADNEAVMVVGRYSYII
jgi:hypothetical protein